MPRSEDYPGQNYFHEHNPNIRRAEESALRIEPKIRYVDIHDRPSDYYLRTRNMICITRWMTKEEMEAEGIK